MTVPCDDLYVSPDALPRDGEILLARQFSRRLAQVGPPTGTITFNADGSILDGISGAVITFPLSGGVVETMPTGEAYVTTFGANSITTARQ